jgi:putative transposase
MASYHRNRIAGGTYFFTLNLRDRRQKMLVTHIDAFRDVLRGVRREIPFLINAMVILPDHGHCPCKRPARRLRVMEKTILGTHDSR